MSLACWGKVTFLRRGIFEVGLYVCLHVLEQKEQKKKYVGNFLGNIKIKDKTRKHSTPNPRYTVNILARGLCFLPWLLPIPGSAGPCCAAAPGTPWLPWPCLTARSAPGRAGSAETKKETIECSSQKAATQSGFHPRALTPSDSSCLSRATGSTPVT